MECKHFNELTTFELHAVYSLRSAVFVVEQTCPYQDVDEKDLQAFHVMEWEGSKLVAYSRILPPGISYSFPAIGRVVVEKNFRNKQLARKLMQFCITRSFEMYMKQDIIVSAQCYLEKFYHSLGFRQEGENYLEDDIPHMKMRLQYRSL